MDASPRTEAGEEDSTDDSSSDVGESDIFGNVHAGNGFYINKTVYNKLHDYQRKALVWFWGLHQNGKGGILGDDMGLGKTIQVIAFLRGLTETKPMIQLKVLIVLPVTLLQNWEREFSEWAPSISVYKLHGVSRNEKEGLLNRVQRTGGVLLTSYGVIREYWHELNRDQQENTFVWDYMICDEGHKIKNPAAQMTKAAHAINARHRFILTGTPIQNNLMEFWALFSFVDGSILGQRQTFRREYELPITQARKKEASEESKAKGNALSESLRKLTDPYVLHRKKADVLKNVGKERQWKEENEPGCSYDWKVKSQLLGNEITPLAHKNDLVMWLPPSKIQIDFYNKYVNLDFFKQVIRDNDKRHVFVELMILKALCDHPRLLSRRACRLLGLDLEPSFGGKDDPSELECAANDITGVSEEVLQKESGKLKFLFELLENLREEGHRCLVFSRSLKMLNMIEKILRARQFRWKRLDGTIKDMNEREAIIEDFQDDDSYHVFLLTTQVGGTGLNLTGADRVVIVDPSWNPSTDNQAVDRAYRIGQTRSVVVYRLITCGTIEEKIYRRQVFKQSIIKQTMGSAEEDTYRYFTSQELRDLFVLDDTNKSVTQLQLEDLHAGQRRSERELDAHITFLQSIVRGISDHDLLFSLDSKTLRAKLKDYDAKVRMAEEQLAVDNTHGLFEHAMNDDRWKGGSTSDEKKWQLSLLHGEDRKALQKVPMAARQIAANSAFDNAIDPFQDVVKEEDPRPGCSIKKEQTPRLPTLHERQSLAKRRLGETTRDPQATDEVWIIDDSSSSEDDLPKASGVKKEGTLKIHGQVRSDSMTDKSRVVKKEDVDSQDKKLELVEWRSCQKEHGCCHGDDTKHDVKKEENMKNGHQLKSDSIIPASKTFINMDVDSEDESLEIVEWRSPQKENGSLHDDDTQHDVKKEENMKNGHQLKSDSISPASKTFINMDVDSEDESLEIVEWRSPQKENGSLHDDDTQHDVKKEGNLKSTHHLKYESVSDEPRTLKKIDNVSSFDGKLGQGDVNSMDNSLEMIEWRSPQKEHGSLQDDDNVDNVKKKGTKIFKEEEEDGSPPKKRAADQDYQFKWLDRI